MIYTDPQKRHDFVFLFDVLNGNPNGDPDAGNLPRLDPETMHGLVTDVCLKRKVRDYVATIHHKPIFIQSQAALNTLAEQACKDVGLEFPKIALQDDDLIEWLSIHQENLGDILTEGSVIQYTGEYSKIKSLDKNFKKYLKDSEEEISKDLRAKLFAVIKELTSYQEMAPGDKKKKGQEAKSHMMETYYDIRMFGAVLTGIMTKLNAGQVRGPMQLTFARSADPILPLDLTITRQARTTVERMETGTTEMGRKPLVPYGLYRGHGFFSPFLAEKTGVTAPDLEIFWEALLNMFDHNRSAARGEMACRGLYIFTHEKPQGNAQAHKLFELIKVDSEKDTPRQFEDYEITHPNQGQVQDGVTLTVLEG